jgi:sugar phosphate isomerase/epimerase
MRIGFNTWSMPTVPYTTFIPALAEIGYRAVALSVVPSYSIGGQTVDNACALDRLTADDRRRIKQSYADHALELPSIVANQSLLEVDAVLHQVAVSRLQGAIDLCVELATDGQVPTLNTGTGGHSGALESPDTRQLLLDRVASLAEFAASRGVVMCIEPHVNAPIDSVERAEWLVRNVNSRALRLDFDISHFEVVGMPMEDVVARLAPLAGAAEIKDQHFRVIGDEARDDGWRVEGNGVGRAVAPDGRPVEFQFLLAGEGTFDLPRYLRLMRAQDFRAPIAFEVSVQCQARPGYDALAAAASVYQWMARGWREAGISAD